MSEEESYRSVIDELSGEGNTVACDILGIKQPPITKEKPTRKRIESGVIAYFCPCCEKVVDSLVCHSTVEVETRCIEITSPECSTFYIGNLHDSDTYDVDFGNERDFSYFCPECDAQVMDPDTGKPVIAERRMMEILRANGWLEAHCDG